jgi:hypothetical protein
VITENKYHTIDGDNYKYTFDIKKLNGYKIEDDNIFHFKNNFSITIDKNKVDEFIEILKNIK